MKRDIMERFNEKYVVNGETGCWEWTAYRNPNGYGRFYISSTNRNMTIHRFAYEVFKGPILPGQYVLHQCDNPICCNPDHLFLGTHQDNMQDMVNKGRATHGSNHYNSKLTEQQIVEIRILRSQGLSFQQIANQFNVHRVTIWKTLNGGWSHVK